jgi:hypothetical protein
VAAAIAAARSNAIDHVNVDLIAGLDGQSLEGFQRDFEDILKLAPDSIHINSFRPVPWTNFTEGGGRMTPEQVRVRATALAWGSERLREHGEELYGHHQLSRKTENARRQVVTDVPSHVDWLVYRSLIYGDRVSERIAAMWAADYDANLDYRERLNGLIEDD